MDVSMTKLVFEAMYIEWKAVDRSVNIFNAKPKCIRIPESSRKEHYCGEGYQP